MNHEIAVAILIIGLWQYFR